MGCLATSVPPRSRSDWLKVSLFLLTQCNSHCGSSCLLKSWPKRSRNPSSPHSSFSTAVISNIWTCMRLAITVPPGRLTCLVQRFKTSNSTTWLCFSTATTVGVTSTPPPVYSSTPLINAACLGRGVSIFSRPCTLRPSPGARETDWSRCTLQITCCFRCRYFLTVCTADRAKFIELGSLAFWTKRTPWTLTKSSRVLCRTLVPINTGILLL